ncbi:RagB/SusD family nutrient uptake outer membrane protein [Rapidithrix thailandica]|uniref:RagB/SusD family nutrient uptake outer membrane protein n=1 Tax=Rapidithrix thailandica TaxID=413964 RepID=A0AAW9S885_9BACT
MKNVFTLFRQFTIQLPLIGALLCGNFACEESVLEPKPVDRITDDLVLKDVGSAFNVVNGLYRNFANLSAINIIAGDMSADNLRHNGTFTQYIEIGTFNMSASNGSASALWGTMYGMMFTVNFLIEGLPQLDDIPESLLNEFLATARFFRAYGYFAGVNTYGDLPLVTSTDVEANSEIPRTPANEVLQFVEEDLLFALNKLPTDPDNSGMLSNGAVKALLARYYLYRQDWTKAEQYASEIINGQNTANYNLESNFVDVLSDFSDESILEVVYSANDNPGTSTNFGLNNLFESRREIIPRNEIIFELQSNGGSRSQMIEFDAALAVGNDNGWTVTRYGPFDNVQVIRLAEIYLIRAEARAQQNKLQGGLSDLNRIRNRAGVPALNLDNKNRLLTAIEEERRVELAFEGHRWYDLKRTNRDDAVMSAVTSNWTVKNKLWPVPQREISNNPALAGDQNPGY